MRGDPAEREFVFLHGGERLESSLRSQFLCGGTQFCKVCSLLMFVWELRGNQIGAAYQEERTD